MINIRKVFLSCINYDHPQKGMRHAFEGIFGRENVREYDYFERMRTANFQFDVINREFLESLDAAKPDWVWLQLQNTEIIKAKTLMEARASFPKAVFSHWMGDCRPDVQDYLASICRATHITFLSSIKHIPLYQAAGAHEVRYLQIGLDYHEDMMQVPAWEPPFTVPDVLFIGNHYGDRFPGTPDRERAIRVIQEAGIDVGVIGAGWEGKGFKHLGSCHVKQQVHCWKRAKVALSVNHFNDAAGYYSDRHLIALASGTPVVCQRIPDLGKDFVEGEELFMFTSDDELLGHVKALLADPELRKRVGSAGRRRAFKDHTWFTRIMEALARVSEIHATL